MRPLPDNRRGGFSLIEALLAAGILAVATGAILLPFTVGARNNTIVVNQAASVNLAEALMEEILTRPYHDPDGESAPGPEQDESGRTLFDNIDDYHGYQEAAGQLLDAAGTLIGDPSLSQYARQVQVEYVTLPGQGDDEPFLRVQVLVYRGPALQHRLTRLIRPTEEETSG